MTAAHRMVNHFLPVIHPAAEQRPAHRLTDDRLPDGASAGRLAEGLPVGWLADRVLI